MANTFTQLNVHCVFAVKGRENIITSDFRDDLHRYMSGILTNDGVFPLAVCGWKDHVHVFFELPAAMPVSKVMQMLKATSSKWVNDSRLVGGKFAWQEGYGAFSHSRSQRDQVIRYIMEQEKHHAQRTFREEYLDMLRQNDIKYEEAYLFDFYD
jgi:putative transposase